MAKKQPKTGKEPHSTKTPSKNVDPNSYLQKNPTWRFNKIDSAHPEWSMKNCCDFNESVLDKLVDFERQTWSEISIVSKKQNHHVSVSGLIKDAQKRLDELKIYEDEVFSLRLSAKERLYGILKDGVYQIIWYDSEHRICPSIKKHT